jgi:hypothetical protein
MMALSQAEDVAQALSDFLGQATRPEGEEAMVVFIPIPTFSDLRGRLTSSMNQLAGYREQVRQLAIIQQAEMTQVERARAREGRG